MTLYQRDPPPAETITLNEEEMVTVGKALIFAIEAAYRLSDDPNCQVTVADDPRAGNPEMVKFVAEVRAIELDDLQKIVPRLDLGNLGIRSFERAAREDLALLARWKEQTP